NRASAGNRAAAGLPSSGEIPQTPGARCIYMIQRMLFETRELNLTEVQNQIYISDYSIQNDLKRIRRMIEPYPGLELVRSRECISLKGDEIVKRKFYRDLLVAEVQENFLNLDRLAHLYKDFDLIEVKDIFVEVLEEYDYSIHEAMFSMLIIHAGTSIERMNACHYIQMKETQQGLEDTIEYQISKTFFERISRRLHIKVQDGEVGMFALVIMGRRASNYASDHVKFGDRWLNTGKLVQGALERLKKLFGVDFGSDEDLVAGLKMHLHGLVERAKNNVVMEDIFLEEIKQRYPLVFDMGVYVVGYLEEVLEISIADMESGFIALHLGAASERMNAASRYRAVMILPHNQAFSDMCEKKILDMFRDRMEIVKKLYYFEEEKVRQFQPDLLLTTVPFQHHLEIPTVNISLFVDPETESGILQALNRLDKKRFQMEFASHIGHLIRKEHYYRQLDAKTPEEVISVLCGGMEQEGIIDENYREIVLKREKMTPTSFANALAIPHAFRAYATKSTIAVAQLKNPVPWGVFEVRLVMLFAINEGDQRMIKIFFDWISDIIGSPERLGQLMADASYEEFVERILG
ncbi:MAG: PRD domain-containing protein, partial [Eubacteriales bacterium]|nr:PRD domain-containing protein [Eubacteriales bacterium]